MLLVVTTRSAAITMISSDQAEEDVLGNDRFSGCTCCKGRSHDEGTRQLLDLDLGPDFIGRVLRHGVHPLGKAFLVVEHVGNLHFTELELGAPEQCIERAHVDADSAVHAQREVNVEAVELVLLAGLAPSAARRSKLLVAFDVDTPVGALAGAQHARGAVVVVQRDHTAGARRWCLFLVRVLDGVCALGGSRRFGWPVREDGLKERLGGHTKTDQHAR